MGKHRVAYFYGVCEGTLKTSAELKDVSVGRGAGDFGQLPFHLQLLVFQLIQKLQDLYQVKL